MTKYENQLNNSFLNENKYIFKKYKPIKKIGGGKFGSIYSTIRLKDKNVFAMKTEKRNMLSETLESEAYYLFILQGFGIPKIITYGHTKKYNILIETLLDISLEDKFFRNKKVCNIVDSCLIGIQIIDRLEWIHSKDIIYRDVKPEHFLLGINDPNTIYIVDFGLCKKYRSSKTGKHVLPKLTKMFNGNLLFSSLNAMKGKELSRRDDLISLGYMIVYLFKRNLPWKFDNMSKIKFFEILNLKDTDGKGELFKQIPSEFIEFIKYSKNLKFEEDPNYSYLRSLLIKILNDMNINYRTLSFSWINSKNSKLSCYPNNNSIRKSNVHTRIIKKLKEEKRRRNKSEIFNNINLDLKNLCIENKTLPFSKKQNDISIQKTKFSNNITFNNNNCFSIKNRTKNLQTSETVKKTNYNIKNKHLSNIKSDNNIKRQLINFNIYSINNNNFINMGKNLKKNKNNNINNIIKNKNIRIKNNRSNSGINPSILNDIKKTESVRLKKGIILHKKNITFFTQLNTESKYNILNDIMIKNKNTINPSNNKKIINNNFNFINNINLLNYKKFQ